MLIINKQFPKHNTLTKKELELIIYELDSINAKYDVEELKKYQKIFLGIKKAKNKGLTDSNEAKKQAVHIVFNPKDVKKVLFQVDKEYDEETYIKHSFERSQKRFYDKPTIIEPYKKGPLISLEIITKGIRYNTRAHFKPILTEFKYYKTLFAEHIDNNNKTTAYFETFIKTGKNKAKWMYLPFENNFLKQTNYYHQ